MRMMTRSITTAAVMYTMAVSNAPAQAARPNFTGVWVMDANKTVVDGPLGAPTSATSTIVQHGDSIMVDREAAAESTGVIKSHTVWGIDGKPWKNTIPVSGETTEVTSVLSWDNGVLVIRATFNVMGNDVELVDRWSMAADGHTLVTSRSGSAGGQDLGSTTMTFVKQ